MQKPPSAEDYDAMTDGIELPGDPKPMGSHALQARRRAINTDRLRAISSTELEAQKEAAGKVKAASPANLLTPVRSEIARNGGPVRH